MVRISTNDNITVSVSSIESDNIISVSSAESSASISANPVYGQKGDKGEKGDTGAQGIQGIQGVAGETYTLPIATSSTLGGIKPDGTTNTVDENGILTVIGGGGSGTSNYADLTSKPKINGFELSGDKTSAELGILTADDLSPAAVSGSYLDLGDTPDIPNSTSDLTNDSNFVVDASYVHTENNFTNALKATYDGAVTESSHSNRTVLDNSTASFTTAQETKLSGIAESANNYVLPTASTSVKGGIKVDGITTTMEGDVISFVGGSGGVWGTIAGNITDQSDLQSALNAKVDAGNISAARVILTGSINGTNAVFTTTVLFDDYFLIYNGLIYTENVEYTKSVVNGTVTFTFGTAPSSGSTLECLGFAAMVNAGGSGLSNYVPKSTTINGYDLSVNRTLTTDDIADSTNKRYCTDAQKTIIANTSGTNTGDQDLSGYYIKTDVDTLLGGKYDSTNFVAGTSYLAPNGNGSSLTGLTKAQVGLGNVPNIDPSAINNQTASYTLTSGDFGKTVIITSSTAVNLTIPNTLSAGFFCTVRQGGGGQITFVGSGGMAIFESDGLTKTKKQYSYVQLQVCATNHTGLQGSMA